MPDEPKDGIYPGTSRHQYERINAVNYSTLKHFNKSAAHYRELTGHPKAPTPAMNAGSALHTLALEPDKFPSLYAIAPKCDRRTTAGKQTWADFEASNRGKEILGRDDADDVLAMSAAINAHETAGPLVRSPGLREVAIVWTHRRTGLRCKALVDLLARQGAYNFVVDVKSTKDASASPVGFPRSVAQMAYHEQAAFYFDGLDAISSAPRRFVWLCVESERPHCVAVYEAEEDVLRVGRALYEQHLEELAACKASGHWPGYHSGIVPLKLPKWANLEDE